MTVKKENFKAEIRYEVSIQLPAFVCVNHYFQRLLIAHPKVVYKLDISNYKQYQMKKI